MAVFDTEGITCLLEPGLLILALPPGAKDGSAKQLASRDKAGATQHGRVALAQSAVIEQCARRQGWWQWQGQWNQLIVIRRMVC